MPIDFPNSPTNGQTFTTGASSWVYNSTQNAWATAGPGGVTSLTGTANQIVVSTPTGNVTLSLPQNIHTAATPTFAALTVSNNITFPTAGDFGLQNTGTGSTLACFYLEKSGGSSQWKTRQGFNAFIDSDTTIFRLSGGGTTVGTFNSSGLSVGTTTGAGIGLKKRSTDTVMLLSYGQSDDYVVATNGGGSSFLRCGTSSATIFVIGATSVAQFASNGDFHPVPDNTYKLGWSGGRWSAVWSATGTIQTSDARTKTDIVNSPLGLSFINRLRPVQYRYIVGSNVVVDNVYNPETGGTDPITEPVPGVRLHAGLLAQEVKQALDDEQVEDFGGWLLTDKDDPDSEQALRYEEFIAPLIRSVQELSAEVAALRERVALLELSAP